MFIVAARCPPPGVEVKLEFAMPACDLVPHPVTLHCVGRVSRVEIVLSAEGVCGGWTIRARNVRRSVCKRGSQLTGAYAILF